jgi:hypothetical protein
VLQSAVTNGATVTSVNIIFFDYYIAKEGVVEMDTAAENAATNTNTNTNTQLQSIDPSMTPAQLWNMEGMTLLPGIDDLRKKTEVTYEPDATTMLNFAQAKQHELPVDPGDPAGQRRLSRHRRQQHLFRHHAERLGFQPHSPAVHRVTLPAHWPMTCSSGGGPWRDRTRTAVQPAFSRLVIRRLTPDSAPDGCAARRLPGRAGRAAAPCARALAKPNGR